jgi:hypothetical protein
MLTLILLTAALFLVSELVGAACGQNVTNDPELQKALDAYHARRR